MCANKQLLAELEDTRKHLIEVSDLLMTAKTMGTPVNVPNLNVLVTKAIAKVDTITHQLTQN